MIVEIIIFLFLSVTALYGKKHPSYPSYVYLLAPISLAILNPVGYILLEIGKLKDNKSDSNSDTNKPDIEILGEQVIFKCKTFEIV